MSQINSKLMLAFSVAEPMESHVHGFCTIGCILPLVTTSAIELPVCSGMGGYLCPISSIMILMYTMSHSMVYSPSSSALVADDITCFMIFVLQYGDVA